MDGRSQGFVKMTCTRCLRGRVAACPHLHADAGHNLNGDVVSNRCNLLEEDDSIVALCTCTMMTLISTHIGFMVAWSSNAWQADFSRTVAAAPLSSIGKCLTECTDLPGNTFKHSVGPVHFVHMHVGGCQPWSSRFPMSKVGQASPHGRHEDAAELGWPSALMPLS